MTTRYAKIQKFLQENPSKVTCRFCGDVRYYSHTCFYEDRCPACGSIAFDCRKVERVRLADVPENQPVRKEWA